MAEPTPHAEHDPTVHPVEGCPECDTFVHRPIRRGFGAGKGSMVVPPKESDGRVESP